MAQLLEGQQLVREATEACDTLVTQNAELRVVVQSLAKRCNGQVKAAVIAQLRAKLELEAGKQTLWPEQDAMKQMKEQHGRRQDLCCRAQRCTEEAAELMRQKDADVFELCKQHAKAMHASKQRPMPG